MSKILLVDDNKTLAKLLAKKGEKELKMRVDVANSMLEAKTLLSQDSDYFLALLDLNLPDAPDGEIVDYVLNLGIMVIVLTGSIDKQTKDLMSRKNIVDYVYKGDVNDVNYIFPTIERLKKNKNHKVLIVDSVITSRNRLKQTLISQQFKVLSAAHGEEALSYFETNKDISLVITDYKLPVVNGVELIQEIRKKHSKDDVAIIGVATKEDDCAISSFLKLGANDFMIKPYDNEEIVCRVTNTLDAYENAKQLKTMISTDTLTSTLNRHFFLKQMEEYMRSTDELCAFGIIDIDELKDVNDKFGQEGGDTLIKQVADEIKMNIKGLDLVSRFAGGEYGVLLKNTDHKKALEWFIKIRAKVSSIEFNINSQKIKTSVSIGVGFGNEGQLQEILDSADEALYLAKKNGKNRVEIIG